MNGCEVRLAYLVNQYPAPSQTFVRREIAALERIGLPVRRYTVRAYDDPLVDPGDRAEHARTDAILAAGPVRIAALVFHRAVTDPGRFVAAVRQAWRLGRQSSRGHLVGLVYLAEAVVLARWLQRDAIDHVHVHFGTNATTVALLARTLGGPTYSFTVHGPEEFDRPEGIKLRDKVAGAAFVLAITEFCRSQIFRWSDADDWAKVHVVRCGLDELYLGHEPPPVPDSPTLLSVGRLSEQKGQLLLVAAANRVLAAGHRLELVIVGEGPMRPEIESAIVAGPNPSAIRLVGLLDNAAVRAAMERSRAVVLPSFAEGLPVVIMEALAVGRPVLTTYIAGIPELVDDQCGWLVPAGDVDALARAIIGVLESAPERLTEMGRVGRARVLERHDVETEAARIAQLVLEPSSRQRVLT